MATAERILVTVPAVPTGAGEATLPDRVHRLEAGVDAVHLHPGPAPTPRIALIGWV